MLLSRCARQVRVSSSGPRPGALVRVQVLESAPGCLRSVARGRARSDGLEAAPADWGLFGPVQDGGFLRASRSKPMAKIRVAILGSWNHPCYFLGVGYLRVGADKPP